VGRDVKVSWMDKVEAAGPIFNRVAVTDTNINAPVSFESQASRCSAMAERRKRKFSSS
jgi:hypothetical protein